MALDPIFMSRAQYNKMIDTWGIAPQSYMDASWKKWSLAGVSITPCDYENFLALETLLEGLKEVA
jgi:hypothetical protein